MGDTYCAKESASEATAAHTTSGLTNHAVAGLSLHFTFGQGLLSKATLSEFDFQTPADTEHSKQWTPRSQVMTGE